MRKILYSQGIRKNKIMSYLFVRSERKWLSENDSSLLEDLQNGFSQEELALKYNKPLIVIRNRILYLALNMMNDLGLGIKTVSNITRLPQDDLQTYSDLIDRKKNCLISKL